MRFSADKLYVDFVSSEGDLAVLYFGWVRLLGFHKPLFGLEWYATGGGRNVLHCRQGNAEIQPGRCIVSLPSLDLHLTVRPRDSGHPLQTITPGLTWEVLFARGEAELRWGDRQWTGCSYADRIGLRATPNRLGLASVTWGRTHAAAHTEVSNRVTLTSGKVWERNLCWDAAGQPDPVEVLAPQNFDGRTLHAGHALDEDRIPNRLTRLLLHRLVPVQEERKLLALPGGWRVHEVIRFGTP